MRFKEFVKCVMEVLESSGVDYMIAGRLVAIYYGVMGTIIHD